MIYDVFAKYGRLAQISMKNAYGFVQFVDPGCSSRALEAEEGTELGGRKIRMKHNCDDDLADILQTLRFRNRKRTLETLEEVVTTEVAAAEDHGLLIMGVVVP